MWKSGQSRERRVKSSPDLSNLCSILIKISLPLPTALLPPLHSSDMSLYVMSLHLVWGTTVLPEDPARPALWAHVADTFIPLLEQGWTQSHSVLGTTSTIFLLLLTITCLLTRPFLLI